MKKQSTCGCEISSESACFAVKTDNSTIRQRDSMTSIPSMGFSPPRSLSSLAKTTPGTVFVGNLSFFCNETHLRELVSTYGEVREVEVVRSRNGNSLLYGFVDFASPVDGENAVQILHRTLFMGRRIRYVLSILFC